MNKKYDVAVYIGRFQPFHQGHLACVREGLKLAKQVFIVVGSTNLPRSDKNPWNYTERRQMILAALSDEKRHKVRVIGMRDYNDDAVWVEKLKSNIQRRSGNTRSIALIGYDRDASSYYLQHFPEWDLIELDEYQDINASHIRKQLRQSMDIQSVTRPVADLIKHFGDVLSFKGAIKD